MKIRRRNDKRQKRKHTKNIKERRKKEERILSAFCSLPGANFSVFLYNDQGDLILMSMDELEMLLDKDSQDV